MGKRDSLGEFEQIVLLAIMRLEDNAYGMTIRREIVDKANRNVSIGALYTTLDRLERKGFVSSHQGDPTPERGGRAKRFFRVEASGRSALHHSHKILGSMWNGIVPNET